MNKAITRIKFGSTDRHGALVYASRFAREDKRIYVIYYDYKLDDWCAEDYFDFDWSKSVAYEDVRYVLPNGEVTKLS